MDACGTVKVLHVTPSVGLSRGGASQAVLELLQALQTQGVEVELVTTNDDGANLLDVPLNQEVLYQQIPTRFFPRFSPQISAVREFAFSGALTGWLWKHMAEYDLIHIHALFSYPATIAMSIARIQKIPYVQQPHGLLCEWSLQQSRLKKQLYLSLIERSNLKHSRRMIVTSVMEDREVKPLNLGVAQSLVPIGLSLPPTIPNAREQLRKQLQLPDHQPIILFLSRLHEKKGLDYLIPALGQLKEPFTFVLAGSGTADYEREVEQLLIKAGIHNRTVRPGFVTGEFKNLLLQGSDIFALTSHSESFGVVVLEAMAAGLTTVLTPGVALASMLQEHQVGYVPDLEVNAIATTLKHCLDRPDQVSAIGQKARQLILNTYTWERIAAQLIQLYQSIDARSALFIPEPVHHE